MWTPRQLVESALTDRATSMSVHDGADIYVRDVHAAQIKHVSLKCRSNATCSKRRTSRYSLPDGCCPAAPTVAACMAVVVVGVCAWCGGDLRCVRSRSHSSRKASVYREIGCATCVASELVPGASLHYSAARCSVVASVVSCCRWPIAATGSFAEYSTLCSVFAYFPDGTVVHLMCAKDIRSVNPIP